MQKLYKIIVAGLSVKSEFSNVRDRLLADFPAVLDVLATTAPATVLVLYEGRDEVDAWLAALSDSVMTCRFHRRSSRLTAQMRDSERGEAARHQRQHDHARLR
jgi:hypothetical protein